MELEELFRPNKRYSFLAGAGISTDSPSNLPLAKPFIQNILEVLDIPSELKHEFAQKIASSELRFEQFMEQLSESFQDDDLHILDLLQMCSW